MGAPLGNKFAVGNKGGRPSDYNEEIADEIINTISSCSIGLRSLCDMNDHWPDVSTLLRWVQTNNVFYERYIRAKQCQAEFLVSEILDIADDGSNDFMTIVKGDNEYEMENKEVTNRSKLRVETRRWIIERLLPKQYGTSTKIEHSGSVEISKLTPEQREKRIQELKDKLSK